MLSGKGLLEEIITGIFDNIGDYGDPFERRCENIVSALRETQRRNIRTQMSGMCGTCSSFLQDVLPDILLSRGLRAECARVSAPLVNDPIHHYNVVRMESEAGLASFLIVDLSAAQFFVRPMGAFSGVPYFVGTRDKLMRITRKAQENTHDLLIRTFPEMAGASLSDFDSRRKEDWDFLKRTHDVLGAAKTTCLLTETLSRGWERIWGDHSRYLGGTFERLDGDFRENLRTRWGDFLQCDPAAPASLREQQAPRHPSP